MLAASGAPRIDVTPVGDGIGAVARTGQPIVLEAMADMAIDLLDALGRA